MAQKLWTVEEVAEFLNCSQQWVYDHTTRKTPRLPSVRIGGLVRFKPEVIQKWVEDREKALA